MKKAILLMMLILFPSLALAGNDLLISKSVFVQVAAPETYEFQTNVFTYFPAGTRLYGGELRVEYLGSVRRLVYSESGITAYIKEGMYWNHDQLQYFRRIGGDKWVFITRPKDIIVPVADNVKLVIGFTRGEKYPLIEESDGSFIITVGKDKMSGVVESFDRNITLPRKYGTVVDLSKELTPQEASRFKLSIIDGISGIKKPCNTKTAIAAKHRGEAGATVGFSLKKFWLSLSAAAEISASMEKSDIEEFDKNTSVLRRYYARDSQSGVYKITRYTACKGISDREYIYTNPEMNEVVVSRKWGGRHISLWIGCEVCL